MDYSQKTQDLIDRQCRNVEREDFVLDKETAEECLLKTYDLFNLPRPKKIVWCKDIFDEKFSNSAGSARSARSAGSAGSAGRAWSAGSARSARSAGSAGSAWRAWSAGSAGSARSAGSAWRARSAWSAGSAGSARSALDYDFDWYIFEFEYCINPDKDRLPNENDFKYLEYCELLMQAKEAGLGYRVEWEDTLYLVPTPLVKIDDKNRFHSLKEPSIRWKDGKEFYYLYGVNFEKELWKKIIGNKLSFKEIMGMSNIEQRMASIKTYGTENLIENANAKLLDSVKGYELYLVDNVFRIPAYFLKYKCPSTDRIYFSGIDPKVGEKKDAIEALKWKFYLEDYEGENLFAQES